jgi:S1-C subfamily serine protease
VATLGDSSQLQVGDWLVAIGNALALPGGPTVTAGVASALGRTVQEPSDSNGSAPFLFDVIQTSAPINPGNSGGPLVNLDGQVVGINTMVAGMAEPGVPTQGIGFAISIAAAMPIANQLVANGHVSHTYLGIRYTALTPVIAARLGINQKTGIAIMSVVNGSPASKAGLQRQDVITTADGKDIVDESGLARVLGTHKAGDKVTLSVLRGSQKLSITVTLAELPS